MNIIFDLGGVIVTWDPDSIIKAAFRDDDERRRVQEGVFDHADWASLHKGTLDLAEAIERFAERTGVARDKIAEFMGRISRAPQAIDESVEMLHELARDGHRLFCLSNMHRAVYDSLLVRAQFWGAFEGIVVSCLVGMMKPEPEIYRYLLATYHLEAGDTVFVDDTQANVDAATSCGIGGIFFTDIESLHRQLTKR